jgi:hypothetical protein
MAFLNNLKLNYVIYRPYVSHRYQVSHKPRYKVTPYFNTENIRFYFDKIEYVI